MAAFISDKYAVPSWVHEKLSTRKQAEWRRAKGFICPGSYHSFTTSTVKTIHTCQLIWGHLGNCGPNCKRPGCAREWEHRGSCATFVELKQQCYEVRGGKVCLKAIGHEDEHRSGDLCWVTEILVSMPEVDRSPLLPREPTEDLIDKAEKDVLAILDGTSVKAYLKDDGRVGIYTVADMVKAAQVPPFSPDEFIEKQAHHIFTRLVTAGFTEDQACKVVAFGLFNLEGK